MTGKQIGGVVCFLVAVLFTVSGVTSLSKGNGPAVDDNSGLGVSRAVGAFLPGFVLFIIGLWLFKKPLPVERDPR